ncbi:FAS1-like dehydratase domain-containing protein [Phycobium rhodophyticola]
MQNDSPQSHSQNDSLDPARASALQVTLGAEASITNGSPLPPFFEQLYFWETRPSSELGRDGHPRTGLGLIPDMGLPRRMWAGGRLAFQAPLLAGRPAEKRSFVEAATHKQGQSGPLAFVTLRHEFHQDGRLCRTEWRDLVYREAPGP